MGAHFSPALPPQNHPTPRSALRLSPAITTARHESTSDLPSRAELPAARRLRLLGRRSNVRGHSSAAVLPLYRWPPLVRCCNAPCSDVHSDPLDPPQTPLWSAHLRVVSRDLSVEQPNRGKGVVPPLRRHPHHGKKLDAAHAHACTRMRPMRIVAVLFPGRLGGARRRRCRRHSRSCSQARSSPAPATRQRRLDCFATHGRSCTARRSLKTFRLFALAKNDGR